MDLDLRRLRYFVEVADQLSFVRAAMRLHITQPALSRQIANLESDLGVMLFERSRSGTSLSREGALLLERARTLLRNASDLERDARLLGRTPVRFVIGFMPGTDAGTVIAEFQRLHPSVDVAPIFTSTTTQAPFLIDGRADIVFCRPPIAVEGVEIVDLFDEPFVVAVERDHPLAAHSTLSVHDVTDTGERVLRRRVSPEASAAPLDDFEPQEAIAAVSAGVALALLPAGIAAFYSDPAVVYIPVTDAAPQPVSLAYRRDRAMPFTNAFAELCRTLIEPRIRELPELLAERPHAPAAEPLGA